MDTRYGFKITLTLVGKKRTKYLVSEVMPLPLTTLDHVEYFKDAEGRHCEILRSFKTKQMAERVRSYEQYAKEIDEVHPRGRDDMLQFCLQYLREMGLAKISVYRLLGGTTDKCSPHGGNYDIYHATEGDRFADSRLLARVLLLCDMVEHLRNGIRSILPSGLASKRHAEDLITETPDISNAMDFVKALVWRDKWEQRKKQDTEDLMQFIRDEWNKLPPFKKTDSDPTP